MYLLPHYSYEQSVNIALISTTISSYNFSSYSPRNLFITRPMT